MLIYENNQDKKKEDAMMYVFLGLGAMIIIVVFIFICQSICSNHSKMEFQKRALIYKKQDLIFRRETQRRSTKKT